ncbi:hypothetical protein GA0115240_10943 [Streptomyces sp. DvalAA-14]|uniref:DUF5955 family protein n=1 Tax=unclassified Streptomyces TaxID=2593676 RepID=UPI00081B3257|nr:MULTISPECIES: DUF2236 domain-containing protein [unclassified Streptomyces]MYS19494.1 DUF2236 domain-containing protein [Streptomyces sp. SID4948]SCD45876.1 hypothetical protein GA0115240_10943 [Streptomyces sp. DvalAA-14]
MSDEIPGRSPVNHGFQVLGGQVRIGNQAVGPGARAVAGSVTTGAGAPAAATAADLLLVIERLLDEHREQLPDQSATRAELGRLREELADPQPEPGAVGRALARLTAFVQPVTPLVAAVGGLAESLRDLLGHG